jgi:hypothetical protein
MEKWDTCPILVLYHQLRDASDSGTLGAIGDKALIAGLYMHACEPTPRSSYHPTLLKSGNKLLHHPRFAPPLHSPPPDTHPEIPGPGPWR